MRSGDLPRHAAVDEGNAADQNGTGPRAALICRIPLIHRPGSARPQVADDESALHIRIAGYEAPRIRVCVHRCSSVAFRMSKIIRVPVSPCLRVDARSDSPFDPQREK